MRIVVLSQWYQPEPEPRAHALAKGLAARGHTVTSITGIPNYPAGEVYPGFAWRPWPQIEMRDGVRVVRVPLFPERSRSVTKRVLNYLSFAVSAALFGSALSGPADVVWVYHPPLTVALPALTISMVRGAPFVYEIQDLWPETLAATGMVRSIGVLKAIGRVARWIYRRAAKVVVISPGFKRNLISKGLSEDSIEVIPNWADEESFRPKPPRPDLAKQLDAEDKFTVLYAGNMGPAQDLGNVLSAAERLSEIPDIRFLLVGDGIDSHALQEAARSKNLRNVRFMSRVSPDMIADLAAICSVQLIHLREDPLFEITIPSKTISALACGKPVLTVSTGDAARIIADAGCGATCRPGDPEALAMAVRSMYELSPQVLQEMGARARAHFQEHFAQEQLIDRYAMLLSKLYVHSISSR